MHIQSAVRPHLLIQHILSPKPPFHHNPSGRVLDLLELVENFVGKDGIIIINMGCNQGNSIAVGCKELTEIMEGWKGSHPEL